MQNFYLNFAICIDLHLTLHTFDSLCFHLAHPKYLQAANVVPHGRLKYMARRTLINKQ